MDDTLEYWLLLLVKLLIWFVEIFTDLAFGWKLTKGWKEERRRAQRSHEHCAQLVDVKWRAHCIDLAPHSIKNYLYVHNRYVGPEYILENKHVTLFTMDTENVIFCVTDPDVDIYDVKRFSFLFVSHYAEAKQLVIMPMASFIRMGDELGDPKVPVSLINMTARCGSTLISHMMARVPNTRSLSEPTCLMQVNNHFRKGWFNWDQTRKLIQTCVRLHCKVEPGSGVERIVIKMTPSASPACPVITEMFPDIKYFFNTRHPKPSMLSLYKVWNTVNRSLYIKLGIYLKEIKYNFYPLPYTDKYWHIMDNFVKEILKYSKEEVMPYVYGACFLNYLECKSKFKYVILYENLTSRPREEAERIFRAMDVPAEHIPVALEALEHDSQNSVFGRREEKLTITPEDWKKIDNVFRSFGIGLNIDMTFEEFEALFK